MHIFKKKKSDETANTEKEKKTDQKLLCSQIQKNGFKKNSSCTSL